MAARLRLKLDTVAPVSTAPTFVKNGAFPSISAVAGFDRAGCVVAATRTVIAADVCSPDLLEQKVSFSG
jgi:hypothetical protein